MNPTSAVAHVQLAAQKLFQGKVVLEGTMLQVNRLYQWAPLVVADLGGGSWYLIKCVDQGESWAARYEYRPTKEHEWCIQLGGTGRWESLAGSVSRNLSVLQVQVDQLNRDRACNQSPLDPRDPYFRVHPVGV